MYKVNIINFVIAKPIRTQKENLTINKNRLNIDLRQ